MFNCAQTRHRCTPAHLLPLFSDLSDSLIHSPKALALAQGVPENRVTFDTLSLKISLFLSLSFFFSLFCSLVFHVSPLFSFFFFSRALSLSLSLRLSVKPRPANVSVECCQHVIVLAQNPDDRWSALADNAQEISMIRHKTAGTGESDSVVGLPGERRRMLDVCTLRCEAYLEVELTKNALFCFDTDMQCWNVRSGWERLF